MGRELGRACGAAFCAACFAGFAGAALAQQIVTAEAIIDHFNSVASQARSAAAAGLCRDFEHLKTLPSPGLGQELNALSPDDLRMVLEHAENLKAQLATIQCPQAGGFALEIGGGATWVSLPQVFGGAKIVPLSNDAGGTVEAPVGASEQTLDGESFNASLQVPMGAFVQGTSFNVSYRQSWFDATSSGAVPAGGRDVAFAYMEEFRLPDGGVSTGIFGGEIGMRAGVKSEAEMFDVTGAFSVPLTGVTSAIVGVRYKNVDWSNQIRLTTPTFSDLWQNTDLDEEIDYYGALVGLQLTSFIPDDYQGPTWGAEVTAALGSIDTSATARQVTRAGPLGKDNPEFNVRLSQSFSESNFSAIWGGSAYVGYRFTPSAEVRMFGTIEHMTDVPYLVNPITPSQQPIHLAFDDLTEAVWGARFIWRPSQLHWHRRTVVQDY